MSINEEKLAKDYVPLEMVLTQMEEEIKKLIENYQKTKERLTFFCAALQPTWEVTYVSNGKYQRWYADKVSFTTGSDGLAVTEFRDVNGQYILVNGWVRVQATKDTRSSQTLYRRKK